MTRFLYQGPNSGITIGQADVMLFNGSHVELPADDEHVIVLVYQGYLSEVAAAEVAPVELSAASAVDASDKKRKS